MSSRICFVCQKSVSRKFLFRSFSNVDDIWDISLSKVTQFWVNAVYPPEN